MPDPLGNEPADPRLGRVPFFDERSRSFPIRALIPAVPPRSYTWSCYLFLNQGNIGSCVGHSITHELAARPVPVPNLTNEFALALYRQAQLIDPWPGEAYEGTSVLAGIQIAHQRKYFQEYRWAFGLEDLVMAVGYKGPAVIGINWYQGMFQPDANGFIHPSGSIAGGHAILANGIKLVWPQSVTKTFGNLDKDKSFVRLHNSWGTWFGKNGDCFISLTDLERLLQEGGEACIPILRKAP